MTLDFILGIFYGIAFMVIVWIFLSNTPQL